MKGNWCQTCLIWPFDNSDAGRLQFKDVAALPDSALASKLLTLEAVCSLVDSKGARSCHLVDGHLKWQPALADLPECKRDLEFLVTKLHEALTVQAQGKSPSLVWQIHWWQCRKIVDIAYLTEGGASNRRGVTYCKWSWRWLHFGLAIRNRLIQVYALHELHQCIPRVCTNLELIPGPRWGLCRWRWHWSDWECCTRAERQHSQMLLQWLWNIRHSAISVSWLSVFFPLPSSTICKYGWSIMQWLCPGHFIDTKICHQRGRSVWREGTPFHLNYASRYTEKSQCPNLCNNEIRPNAASLV